jgi:hypothetical protein
MTRYNGYEVYPAQLRARSGGFTDGGHALEEIKAILERELGDGRYLGGDRYAAAFRKNYTPLLESIEAMLDDNAQGLHGVRAALDQMATAYEKADAAGTVPT